MKPDLEAILRELYEVLQEKHNEKSSLWGELIDVTGKAKEFPREIQLLSRELEGWTCGLQYALEEIVELIEELPKEDPSEGPTSSGQGRRKGAMH